ncbi:hypothetical protein [Pelosinus sp. sgz500959]|uniref:hypothetical protein n=1 Tax=Pelosinus sp. sgz500959 TaxID=3242472 RepID=UPI003671B4EC
MSRIIKHNQGMELEFEDINTWEDFELIANILENKVHAVASKKLDGPYSRYWNFNFKNHSFELRHDDFEGNSIKVNERSDANILFLDDLANKIIIEYKNH